MQEVAAQGVAAPEEVGEVACGDVGDGPVHETPVHDDGLRRKDPVLSCFCSLFVTGLGQMINGQIGKGIMLFSGCYLLGGGMFVAGVLANANYIRNHRSCLPSG
ncbi:MAG: hypothetical protein LBH06_06475 [Rikenellaceae bacterium]|nr:hypothetical protein [Rikenellaceae bacterium]